MVLAFDARESTRDVHANRVFKRPWFAAETRNLKAILLQESPAAFRVRNLFVSANALSRGC